MAVPGTREAGPGASPLPAALNQTLGLEPDTRALPGRGGQADPCLSHGDQTFRSPQRRQTELGHSLLPPGHCCSTQPHPHPQVQHLPCLREGLPRAKEPDEGHRAGNDGCWTSQKRRARAGCGGVQGRLSLNGLGERRGLQAGPKVPRGKALTTGTGCAQLGWKERTGQAGAWGVCLGPREEAGAQLHPVPMGEPPAGTGS